ncbi:MAG: DUF4136 domain-containing protein [Pseudomonadota bacterium]|nr:DUF4136 domain-containing protein [Pseudomonadota bacterium]
MRRACLLAITFLVVSALGGCASSSLSSEVSTFGAWPADRRPDTYAFERLPSQQAEPEKQQRLEDAARVAIENAGFKPADDPNTADVTVQLAARADAVYRSALDDPLWWNGGLYHPRFGYAGYGGFGGGLAFGRGFGLGLDDGLRHYAREVAVLIRDRQSGTALYEARASSGGMLPLSPALLSAMFQAALTPFPNGDAKPRSVTTPLEP